MSEKTLNSANAMDAERATKTLRDEFAIAALPICYELVRDSLIQ